MVQHQDLAIDVLLYQLDFLPVLSPLCSLMLRWLRLSTDPSQVTCLATIVTLCCSKGTLGGLACGLISHTCSNYCSWPRPVIRGNLANVPRVRYRYSCTTKALQFACILGSCLHNLCVQSLRLVETSSPSPSATFFF